MSFFFFLSPSPPFFSLSLSLSLPRCWPTVERGHAGVSRWRCSPCLCTCERRSVSARRDWWRGNVWRRVCRKEGTRVVAAQWDHYCNAVSNPRAYRLISLFLSLARNSVLLLLSSLYGVLMYPAHFHSCDIQSFCVLATIGAHRWYFWWIKNAAGSRGQLAPWYSR